MIPGYTSMTVPRKGERCEWRYDCLDVISSATYLDAIFDNFLEGINRPGGGLAPVSGMKRPMPLVEKLQSRTDQHLDRFTNHFTNKISVGFGTVTMSLPS